MIEDNNPDLLDEAIRLCNKVANETRKANTFRGRVNNAAEYAAGQVERCAAEIEKLQKIRRGEL